MLSNIFWTKMKISMLVPYSYKKKGMFYITKEMSTKKFRKKHLYNYVKFLIFCVFCFF